MNSHIFLPVPLARTANWFYPFVHYNLDMVIVSAATSPLHIPPPTIRGVRVGQLAVHSCNPYYMSMSGPSES